MQIGGTTYPRASVDFGGESAKVQNRFTAGNGTARVADRDTEEQLLTFTISRLTWAQFTTLRTYLTATANYAANTIAIVDDYGQGYTVRWWDSRLKWRHRAGRFVEVTLTFRVEA